MSGLVDPTNTDLLSHHVDLVDATWVLRQPPIDRDGLIKERSNARSTLVQHDY